MLHDTETLALAAWPGLKAKSLSGGCKIVLLNSSSFKTHVHLLHVVAVNQAIRLCSFSEFSICRVFHFCVFLFPDGNVCVFVLAKLEG